MFYEVNLRINPNPKLERPSKLESLSLKNQVDQGSLMRPNQFFENLRYLLDTIFLKGTFVSFGYLSNLGFGIGN
jgi:hypothetical protein